jgi:hypothetical protein
MRPQDGNTGWWSSLLVARLSYGLPGVDVAGTRGGLRCGHCLSLLRLVGKLPHVGTDVDGLVDRLHRPMNCG